MNRSRRAAVAAETVEICQLGRYQINGQTIHIKNSVQHAVNSTVHYPTGSHDKVLEQSEQILATRSFDTQFELKNCTSLEAATELVSRESSGHIACLNFASAKNPGGGFLNGSQAQEESLARASALYACIQPQQAHYQEGRSCSTLLYTDSMLFSPAVPVFRDDSDSLIEPYEVSFITSAAVNASRKNANPKSGKIRKTMMRRFEKVLAISVIHGVDTLVLGAWGCGVFRNEPAVIADCFYDQLVESKLWRGAFKKVYFGVLDRRSGNKIFGEFERRFAKLV